MEVGLNRLNRLLVTDQHFTVQRVGIPEELVFDRRSGRCFVSQAHLQTRPGEAVHIYFVLGIIPIKEFMYLAVVTEASIIGNLRGSDIYMITGVRLLEYEVGYRVNSKITKLKEAICKYLAAGFYFSFTYDLTSTMQNSVRNTGSLYEVAERQFYWNSEIQKDLIQQAIPSHWIIPIIQGYIGFESFVEKGIAFEFTIISRRSWHRAGTRYNVRGVDHHGNAANFVETEQILQIQGFLFSYVQTRGSVPMFWEQTGILASLSVSSESERNLQCCAKHLAQLLEDYNGIILVNSLSVRIAAEQRLTEAWETSVRDFREQQGNCVQYTHFDFHTECRGEHFENIGKVVRNLEGVPGVFTPYAAYQQQYLSTQQLMVRTNCLDCLDRTNILQMYFGWSAMSVQMRMTSLNWLNRSLEEVSTGSVFGQAFRRLWLFNGDMLSHQYTGTKSPLSYITQGGVPSLTDYLKRGWCSVERLYKANLQDENKQLVIDTILRKRAERTLMIKRTTSMETSTCPQRFTLKVVTWNLAGKKLAPACDISTLLLGETFPDVLAINVQEVVKLNATNVILKWKNRRKIQYLRTHIENHLRNLTVGYVWVIQKALVGCVTFLYVKEGLYPSISDIHKDTVKLGFGGNMGNKGGIAIRFTVLRTSICVINCHLASGVSNLQDRRDQLETILLQAFQKTKYGPNTRHISTNDFCIVCGDLNFRVPLERDDVIRRVIQHEYSNLLANDQLIKELERGWPVGYTEEPITFPPTYKYKIDTDSRFADKKNRVPAWCDRILFSKNGYLENVRYYSFMQFNNSDHKPVVADFTLIPTQLVKQRSLSDERKLIENGTQLLAAPQPRKRTTSANQLTRENPPPQVDLLGLHDAD